MSLGIPTMVAAFLPLAVMLALCPPAIQYLQQKMFGQFIREDGPESHHSKAGTPTGGGVIILTALLITWITLMLMGYLDATSIKVWLVCGITLALGLLGFADDYMKIAKKHNKGVSGWTKLAVQIVLGLLAGWLLMTHYPQGDVVSLFGIYDLHLNWVYPVFAAFVITGASNSVNLTDGLDGLAAGTAIFSFFALGLIFQYFSPDLTLLAHTLAGACLGFLIFNHYPARIFMGDTGSLALGGALGALALCGKLEMWLLFLAFIYIAEALSVILQVASFKSTGKRIFRMAPLHHHFELGGWPETRVVFVFVTLQMIACTAAVLIFQRVL